LRDHILIIRTQVRQIVPRRRRLTVAERITADGGVQSFGDAAYHGSLPSLGVHPALPVVSLVPTPDGGGYWLFGSDGGVFAFGDAGSLGSLPGLSVHVGDVVGAVPTSS